MNSIGEVCNEVKRDYDACFQNWFAENFLKGDANDSICAPLFRVYQQCLKKAIKEHNLDLQELDINHLGTDNEKKTPS